jgi:hypothetical protein
MMAADSLAPASPSSRPPDDEFRIIATGLGDALGKLN